jgi:transposase
MSSTSGRTCTARSHRSPWSNTGWVRGDGKIGMTPEALRACDETLTHDDEVALAATGTSDAIAVLRSPLVARVVCRTRPRLERSPRRRSRPTSSTARILAELLVAEFLPPLWVDR